MAQSESYLARAASVGASVQGSKDGDFQEAVKGYAAEASMLHGDRAPSQGINRERPEHVLMCYMQASGKTIVEIAEATGYSVGSVRLVQRQPWFRKRFLAITAAQGGDAVSAFLKGETMASLEVLVKVRDDNVAERPHVSAAAANSILDRALGKPTQHIESDVTHSVGKAAAEASEVDRQIAALHQELQSRGIPTGTAN